ncbi:methylmalonyl-CoA epimerase [Marinigracilibium pacificum]|uniref:Methylmalonyl-CoA epimerase n=1 Tax=Marinigracilibium pacificum TaxID=2729599 RepID=A0A848IX95_9BACT|nr:methylmalonyl-CoA epimerase [Marinigracilibium pacificum]NMM48927.1 methylmalonyl-CoA epimerase [Marinigracilibium pacificum]
MIDHIEHLGIAVKDLKKASAVYEKLLGVKPYKEEKVESEGVTTLFFQTGESKIELLEATNENSPINKFIEKKGEGIHHVAFAVKDIKKEMQRLRDEGFTLLNAEPKKGADNKLICFVHPKDNHGVLVELCQDAD